MSISQTLTGAATVAAVFIALPLMAPVPPGPTIIYVDDDTCPDEGSGTELDPYCSIQTAIDNAGDGDEIVVAPGTYFETIDFLGKAVTLRSSDGPEVTTIDAQENGTVVTCHSGEGPKTVLDGLTITGGSSFQAGGMRNSGSSPSVTTCTFVGNAAGWRGGAMFNENSSPTVTDCTFVDNSAHNEGGAMFNENSNPTVTDCTFERNRAYAGGGMFNVNSSPRVKGCEFVGNDGQGGPGGAGSNGAGMANTGGFPIVKDCIFAGNWRGGVTSDSGVFVNCLFNGNTSTTCWDVCDFYGGGGMWVRGSLSVCWWRAFLDWRSAHCELHVCWKPCHGRRRRHLRRCRPDTQLHRLGGLLLGPPKFDCALQQHGLARHRQHLFGSTIRI
jgi:hypothetical protein